MEKKKRNLQKRTKNEYCANPPKVVLKQALATRYQNALDWSWHSFKPHS